MSQNGRASATGVAKERKRSNVLTLRPVDREMARLVDDKRLGMMAPGRSALIRQPALHFRSSRSG